MFRSLPKVGVDAVLCMVMEEMEDELSARARGARGGGLPETGGLKGRDWRRRRGNDRFSTSASFYPRSRIKRMEGAAGSYQVCDRFPRWQLGS